MPKAGHGHASAIHTCTSKWNSRLHIPPRLDMVYTEIEEKIEGNIGIQLKCFCPEQINSMQHTMDTST